MNRTSIIRKLGWTQELKDLITQHEPTLPKYEETNVEVPAPVKSDQNGKADQMNGTKGAKSGNRSIWNGRNPFRQNVPSRNLSTGAVPNSIVRRHLGNNSNAAHNIKSDSARNGKESSTDASSSNDSSDSTSASSR